MTLEASFAAACEALVDAPASDKIGLAVSGGSDSTALLCLSVDHFGANRVVVFSVDHGLRADAVGEVRQVADLCARLGCAHHILNWNGWDGQGNLQAAARTARYGLIAQAAQQSGIETVLLGHTADDQAETVLMRLARGSGVDGLAAMRPVRQADGVLWVRPMLDLSREALRTYLRARDVVWSEDPSNEDPAFDRIQLRQAMPTLEAIGLTRARLIQTAQHMARAQTVLWAAAQELAEQIVSQEAGDLIIERSGFEAAPEETQTRLLAEALCFVSGQAYRPRYAAVQRLIGTGQGPLHGALLSSDSATLRITREAAALTGVTGSAGALFDGRWRLTGPAGPEDVVRAVAEDGLAQIEGWRDTGLPRPTALALPSVWQGDQLIAAPLLGHNTDWKAELFGNRADFFRYLSRT